MKIRVVACCRNEEDMLPFFLQHYMFADKIIIHDCNSTDNSQNIIRSCSKAELIVHDQKDVNDGFLLEIKNESWKSDRNEYDWNIIVDIDEFIYHSDIVKKLEHYKNFGITIPKISGYDMYSVNFPVFDSSKNIFDSCKYGVSNNKYYSKSAVFNPQKVDINYDFGCHWCNAKGDVKYSDDEGLILFHFQWFGYEKFSKKYKLYATMMSSFNHEKMLAGHIFDYANVSKEHFSEIVRQASIESNNLQHLFKDY